MRLYNPIIEKGRDLSSLDRSLIVSPAHDKPGRSASLLWESLFEISGRYIPRAVSDFFSSTEIFAEIDFLESIPEHHSAFDDLGKGRMHDLIIEARNRDQKVIIAIEAKVDEPFDHRTVKGYQTSGEDIIASGKNSNKPLRIDKLLNALFKDTATGLTGNLKYQLVQATAGTLVEAKTKGADIAIFCVLNFTPSTLSKIYSDRNSLNSKDLNQFINVFTNNVITEVLENHLYGPYYVPGDKDIPAGIPLYFLKLQQTFPS